MLEPLDEVDPPFFELDFEDELLFEDLEELDSLSDFSLLEESSASSSSASSLVSDSLTFVP